MPPPSIMSPKWSVIANRAASRVDDMKKLPLWINVRFLVSGRPGRTACRPTRSPDRRRRSGIVDLERLPDLGISVIARPTPAPSARDSPFFASCSTPYRASTKEFHTSF